MQNLLSKVEKVIGKGSPILGSHFPALQKLLLVTDDDSPILSELKSHLTEQFTRLEISYLIHQCRSLVGYLKKSGVAKDLKNTVKLDIDTRWNYLHVMLSTIDAAYDDVSLPL